MQASDLNDDVNLDDLFGESGVGPSNVSGPVAELGASTTEQAAGGDGEKKNGEASKGLAGL